MISEKYEYSAAEQILVKQINFDAQSVWYQMNNKPQYWLAWQALSQVSSLMYDDLTLKNRLIAYNALKYLF